MTAPDVDDDEQPDRLTDLGELLWRQVHPKQLTVAGDINKEAFNPSKLDDKMLSTLRERIGPAEAYRRWTEDLGKESIGTYAVTVGEVDGTSVTNQETGQTLFLHAVADAAVRHTPDHASIIFTALSKGQREQAARKLREIAMRRGCQYAP